MYFCPPNTSTSNCDIDFSLQFDYKLSWLTRCLTTRVFLYAIYTYISYAYIFGQHLSCLHFYLCTHHNTSSRMLHQWDGILWIVLSGCFGFFFFFFKQTLNSLIYFCDKPFLFILVKSSLDWLWLWHRYTYCLTVGKCVFLSSEVIIVLYITGVSF